MSKAETAFGLGILIFGLVLMRESLKLPYFVEEVPGPGFLPLWLSLGIVPLGAVLSWRGLRSAGGGSEKVKWPDARGRWRIGLLLAALFAALLLLDSLGFLVTVTLFVGTASFTLGTRSWRELIPIPLLAAVVLYSVFALFLKVPLPKGLVGFLG